MTQIKRLEFWEFVRGHRMEPHQRKTIRSLIKDYGKSVKDIPHRYKNVKKIYYIINKLGTATKADLEKWEGISFQWTSYPLQYLLLRGLIDRKKQGKKHVYFITGSKCGYNEEYSYLLNKRW
jgi:hypothetical protein